MIEKIKNSIVLILIIIPTVLFMVYYGANNNKKSIIKQKDEKIQYLSFTNDSILAIPPDTIKQPIRIIKDSIIYRTVFVSNLDSSEFNVYNDSIRNDSVDLNVTIRAKELYDISYAYRPVYKYQETIIEKKVPQYINVPYEVPVNTRGLFVNAGLGYSDEIAIKAGLMYLTRKNYTYNYDFVRYGTKNIHIISFGVKL